MRMTAFAASVAALALLPAAAYAEPAPQTRHGGHTRSITQTRSFSQAHSIARARSVARARTLPSRSISVTNPSRSIAIARGGTSNSTVNVWHGGGRWHGGRWHGGRWNGSGHRWGGRYQGRWHGGYFAPGGWGGYRPAFVGYQLPGYWMQPDYGLSYQTYGLPAPHAGYRWSRYYDDAVMIGADGRVHDLRQGIDWNRYEGGYAPGDHRYDDRRYDDGGYDDGPYDDEFDGPGDPDGDWRGDRRGPPPGAPYPRPGDDDAQSGRWSGTWTGEADGRPYSYEGEFDGEWRPDGAGEYGPYRGEPPYAPLHAPGRNPAMVPSGSTVIINGVAYPGGGHVANGYYYPPATITTITVAQPAVSRTVTYETVRSPGRTWKAKPKKRWKPKAKCAC